MKHVSKNSGSISTAWHRNCLLLVYVRILYTGPTQSVLRIFALKNVQTCLGSGAGKRTPWGS